MRILRILFLVADHELAVYCVFSAECGWTFIKFTNKRLGLGLIIDVWFVYWFEFSLPAIFEFEKWDVSGH